MSTITVLFGTESGNAQELATRTGKALDKAGLKSRVVDMLDFDAKKLPELDQVLIVTSTYGNGDPPSNAEALHGFLMKRCPPLPKLRFSVCGLGDTTYERFANCGKEFDKRLGELGATRIVPRKDCDVDYEEPWQEWLDAVIPALKALGSAPAAAPAAAKATSVAPAAQTASAPPVSQVVPEPGTRRHPLPAKLLERRPLTATGSTKEVLHVAFEAPAGLKYELGDSIGLWVSSDPESARSVAAAAGLEPMADAPVNVNGESMRFADALVWRLDLQHVDARLLERLHGALPPAERQAMAKDAHVEDVLRDKPAKWSPQELVECMRPIQPRPYSIASSPLAHPGQIHFTVGIVRYDLRGKRRAGVASSLLADRLPIGAPLPAFVHVAPGFRLAAPDVPIVMIGPGTGIAPFRAFLQHRKATGAKGPSWLFFGERQRATDFLYEAELTAMQKEGTLAKLDLAFSRDQAEKIYVQHRMRERAAELYAWIERGAVVYVCGDAHRMAPDVHATLVDILAKHGGKSPEAALDSLHEMEKRGRYQRDVY